MYNFTYKNVGDGGFAVVGTAPICGLDVEAVDLAGVSGEAGDAADLAGDGIDGEPATRLVRTAQDLVADLAVQTQIRITRLK